MSHSSKKIRVLIIDDHIGMREGICAIINVQPDMTVLGEAGNGREAVEQFKNLQPDVAIMDLNLPEICGVEAIGLIRMEFPNSRFIVITALPGNDCLRQAFGAGAMAILLKDMLRKELLPAVRAVHAGERYLPAVIARRIGRPD